MLERSQIPNGSSTTFVRKFPTDRDCSSSHYPIMVKRTKRAAPTQADFKHTWYPQEWMKQSQPPKKQADLMRDLGWSKAKASGVYNGQQYTQQIIDELAPYLNTKPFELLMHPDDAMAYRRIKQDSARIATSDGQPIQPAARPIAKGAA